MKRLITFADITARTTVELGGDAHKFTVAIPLAEQRHLRPVLGSALFSELLNFVQQETPDTEDVLAVLAEQVKDMLAAWAVVEAWPSLLGHIAAAGFVTKVGAKADGTNLADVQLANGMLANLRDTALWRSQELATWLFEQADNYPAFVKPAGAPSTEMALGGLLLD